MDVAIRLIDSGIHHGGHDLYSEAPKKLAYADGTEVRHRPIVFCTQFKKKDWHLRLGGGAHAAAIMDRIAHNATWVDMGEANMRRRRDAGR